MQNEKLSHFCARVLCGAMVLGFVACNSSEPDSTPPSYTINLQQTQGHGTAQNSGTKMAQFFVLHVGFSY